MVKLSYWEDCPFLMKEAVLTGEWIMINPKMTDLRKKRAINRLKAICDSRGLVLSRIA